MIKSPPEIFTVGAEPLMGHLTHIWVQDPTYGSFDPHMGHYIWGHCSNILELNT